MGSTQERIKKRREYIKRAGMAYTQYSFAMLLVSVFAFLALCLIGLFIAYLSGNSRSMKPAGPFALIAVAAVFVMVGVTTCVLVALSDKVRQRAEQIPYVPPVTGDTFPAEEVLVRGSEEPAQEQSKVLLRGTDGSTGAGELELLRSSQQQDTH
ncbi:MAG TPA: hypothetical protein VFA07_17470 [Chthonomonadaceae bacterium]|nr:hypothetical protein [Chthonomonadaceae bacterium]